LQFIVHCIIHLIYYGKDVKHRSYLDNLVEVSNEQLYMTTVVQPVVKVMEETR